MGRVERDGAAGAYTVTLAGAPFAKGGGPEGREFTPYPGGTNV
jgi:hypothetical protein